MDLYEKAMESITELFSDMSVSKSETKRKLNLLIGEIEIMVETIGDDDSDDEDEDE